MTHGIYTSANDVVYDQLVALLNSIEVNAGPDIPVCVIAYDDRLDRVKTEISQRKNVELLDDPELFAPWEQFSYEVWKAHPYALKQWSEQGIQGVRRLGMNRRYCAFDSQAPFDKFLYFDADVLVLNSLDYLFEQLNNRDVVVYDFQYKDPSHIYNANSEKLLDIFPEERINREIFCAGFYGSKRGLLPPEQRAKVVNHLNSGEAEILYLSAPNQSVLNYTLMRSELDIYNFALELPKEKRTGCSVTSPHFEEKDRRVYDKGVPLTYLHFIGISASIFTRLCSGENITFPYRDSFLYYRYLNEPECQPQFQGKPVAYDRPKPSKNPVKRWLQNWI
ncbi:Npun_R2821/Npun_R2822 family protein [Roseofilum casamattae]|uniref:Sugar transferase n=1 Tax=Roseofilum casamattae BLCC-M143 TaxID=3022442 RepID=A0ABT7C2G8_9CYAN|nr:Npun_R2821/Npun_R2822 family protein [Roseofilum casamattae]MDJ1185634.1 sugar transferase [Roseofilum casamattae BLCC-M143]